MTTNIPSKELIETLTPLTYLAFEYYKKRALEEMQIGWTSGRKSAIIMLKNSLGQYPNGDYRKGAQLVVDDVLAQGWKARISEDVGAPSFIEIML